MRVIKLLVLLLVLVLGLGMAACEEGSSAPPINPDGVQLDGAKDGGADQGAQVDQGQGADHGGVG